MKKLIVFIILILGQIISGQEKYSPTVVILNAQETIIPIELDSIANLYIQNGLSKQAKKI